jgi:hypothetical protein
MPKDIFLSYSRKDTDRMQLIKQHLQKMKFTIWTDEKIEPGTLNWRMTIQKAILKSACFVCVLTPNSSASKWVYEELVYAQTMDKKIYFIHMDGAWQDVAMLGFAAAQTIDIREKAVYESRMMQLVRSIRQNHFSQKPLAMTATLKSSVLNEPSKPVLMQLVETDVPQDEHHMLLVVEGHLSTPLTRVQLIESRFTIGRASYNSLMVDDMGVSDKHCQLVHTEHGFFLLDLASTNGTQVNRQPIIGQALQDEDKIYVGNIVMMYRKFTSFGD